MRKLTHSDLTRPNVTLRIPGSKWNLLPKELRDTLEMYLGRDVNGYYVYTVPAYIGDDFEAASRALTEGQK